MSDKYRPQPVSQYEGPASILQNAKLKLTTYVEGVKIPPSLAWDIIGNNPRLTIWNGSEQKPITARMDVIMAKVLMRKLKEAALSREPYKQKFEFYKAKYDENNKPTSGTELESVMIIGKDKEGHTFIAATKEGFKPISFNFTQNNKWFKVSKTDGSGEMLSSAEYSCLMASDYADFIMGQIDLLSGINYQVPENKGSSGGGNRGGYNNNNNKPRNTSSSRGFDDGFGDDIPL